MFDDERSLDRLLGLVRDYAGLDFPPGRRVSAERPIRAAIHRLGLAGVNELTAHLARARNVGDLESLAASLTIGETHFFRNQPQLDALRNVVLPEIVGRVKGRRRLRIWSAGCSTGEEAYSVAIALDAVLPDQVGWSVDIVGTDINSAALETARQAVYGEWSFRGVPAAVRDRYFQPQGRLYRLDRRICEAVRFRQLNLTDDAEVAQMATDPFDLILCRNVLIYFRPDTIDRVVTALEGALAPHGWLVTGHAESPMPVFRRLLSAAELPSAVMYRKRDGQMADETQHPQPPEGTPKFVPDVTADTFGARHQMCHAESRLEDVTSEPCSGDSDVVVQALAMVANGDRQMALDLLHADAERHPADPAPLVAAARILAGAVQYEAASHVIQLAIERDPGVALTHYVHALILQGAGRFDQAVAALRRTTYLDPTCELAYFTLSTLMAKSGDAPRARDALDRVLELLAGADDDTVIDIHEDLTVGRLRQFATVQRQLMRAEVTA